ncbi:hypothetical protein ACVILK_005287 [Bradyrhizobium embrapense]
MIILGPPLILLVIGLFCWLAFMLPPLRSRSSLA